MATRVVLAMSGGVDSSASAWLLKQQGYEVIGLFMRSGASEERPMQSEECGVDVAESSPSEIPSSQFRTPNSARQHVTAKQSDHIPQLAVLQSKHHKQGCCSAADAADARRAADRLDIPFHALNFKEAFGRIKDYFVDEYLAGRTPNPCVMCNNWLKFGKLWEFAQQVGAERIATGHYARIGPSEGSAEQSLLRGTDRRKDQSYVLFGIGRALLDKVIFPVGGFSKPEIREFARDAGLRVADKRDSQEICFIPDQDYVRFIHRHRGEQETAGELVDTAGHVVGRHDGYQNFTIGQRKGLGVTFGQPRYVITIEPVSKRVVIGTKEDLARRELEADGLNWLVNDVPSQFTCRAQIRYQHQAAEAEVHVAQSDRMTVRFQESQYGIAPGQAVVLYDGQRVLGGGWIR